MPWSDGRMEPAFVTAPPRKSPRKTVGWASENSLMRTITIEAGSDDAKGNASSSKVENAAALVDWESNCCTEDAD